MVNLGELAFSIIAEDKASDTLGGVGDRIQGLGPKAVALGAGMTVAGAAITGLIDANRPMDAAFKTTALTMGVSDQAVKDLARGLQSVDSPIDEVARTLDILARAGMTNVDSMGQTASAFDTLADATGVNADTLTDAMVPAFAALGIELDKAPNYVDGLATMFRTSNVDLGDFSTLMTRMGPDLGEMGLGLQDVEGILMSFADRGITGRKATSELTEAINAADGDISTFYDSIGMTADELGGYKTELEKSEGAAAAFAEAQNSSFGTMDKLGFKFTEIKQGLGDLLTPFEGVATAALAAGPAVASVGGIMSSDLLPKLKETVGGISGAGGLTGAFGLLSGGVTAAIGPLLAFIAPLAAPIVIIAAIAAAIYLLNERFNFIGGIIEWLGKIWKGFGDWLGDTFGPILEGITGFFGELFGELDGAAGPVEAVLGWFKGLGETLLSVGGYIGGILTPIIQGLASLIGSVLGPYIKYQVEQFTAFAGILYGAVSTAIAVVWDALVGIGTFLMETFGPAWAALQVVINQAWAAICALFAPGGPTDLVAILGGIWTAISTYAPIAWRIIQEAVITAAGLIWTWLSTEGVRLAGEAVAAIWAFISAAVPAAWTVITNAVITAAGAIWSWLSTEGLRLAGEAVAAIWTFIVDGIPAAWGIIYAAVKAAAIGIWTWLSTDGLQLAGDAVKAIWDAICTYVPIAWGLIWDALKGVFSMIVGWFSGDANTEANDSVKGIWDAICTYVPIAWEAIKAAVIKWATLIWDWLKTDGKDLAFFALKLIWDVITEYIPTAWDLIKQAVIKAAGIIWNWLSTEGLRLAGEAVKAIWNWVTENVPVAWELIKNAVIKAAGLIWSWMTNTAPGLAVAAIAAAWSAIAGAVPGAWEAIKSAVATAAQNVWDEAQRILKKVFTFELPDIVGAARRAYDAAQRALKGDDSAGPAVAPTAAPGIDINNPVAVAPSQTGGRWVDGHYISPGANGYWDHGTWVPVHHTGGLAADEGLALLLKNERVLSPSQTRDYDAGLLDLIKALTRKLDSGGTGGNVIIQGNVGLAADYPYDRLLRDIRRDLAQTRTSRGILS